MWGFYNFYNQVSGLADGKRSKRGVAAAQDPLVVFVSYSRNDFEVVHQMDMALRDEGFKTILDVRDVQQLEDWHEKIEHQIARCDAFLFAMSDSSLTSEICNKELSIAVENGKKLIPVAIEFSNAALPNALQGINFIFAYSRSDVPNSGLYHAIKQICYSLGVDLQWSRMENALMEQAERWIRRGRLAKSGFLMKADMLRDALIWRDGKPERAEIRQEILDYIEASKAHEKETKKRFNTLWIGALILAGIFTVSPTIFRILDDYDASRNARRDTFMLALQADRYLVDGNPEKALMFALAADPAGIRKDVNPDMNGDRPDIAHQRLLQAYEAMSGKEALGSFQRLGRIDQVKLACATLAEKTGINLNDLSEDTIRDEPILLASINPACPE